MTLITDNPSLGMVVQQQMRPRAETILGMQVQLQDDYAVLSPLASGLSNVDTTPINDGVAGLYPFRNMDFVAYVGLIQQLIGAATSIAAALQALQVRPLSVCAYQFAPSSQPIDSVAHGLQYRIRPMAESLQLLRYQFQQDVGVISGMLAGLNATDTIQENRGDLIAPVQVQVVSTMLAFENALIQPGVLTTEVNYAVNSASVNPSLM